MRYLIASSLAIVLVFTLLWVGSWIATTVSQPHRQYNDFTVGRRMELCGYKVDMRHSAGGYDLDEWKGKRCETLSELDRCVLACLSGAGTVEIGAACFSDCVAQ